MDERDGFYFHRSFWDAISLMAAKDQLAIFRAIVEYGLDGKEPEKLSNIQKASFLLVRPVLQKGRNKASAGKKGGSKRQANGKQTASKTESDSDLLLSDNNSDKGVILTDYDKGLRTRDEGVNDCSAPYSDAFCGFWNAYPKKVRMQEAWEAWKKLNPERFPAKHIMKQLDIWKGSRRWKEDGGEFIPRAENFLDSGREYLTTAPAAHRHEIPKGASGELGEAEMDAIQSLMRNAEGSYE